MILAGDRTADIAKQLVMSLAESIRIEILDLPQPFRREETAEDILEAFDFRLESSERCTGTFPMLLVLAFEQPTLDTPFGFDRREIRESQKIFGLKMGTFRHELFPPFIVDDTSHSFGEPSLLGIIRS